MLLEVKDVTKFFGGLCAISQLNFEIREKEILGVIGPNGSGKTTLFNLITGVHKSDGGQILFRGERITGRRPHEIVRRGIARTFQVTKLFGRQTGLNNVIMGLHCRTHAGVWGGLFRSRRTRAEEKASRESALELLEFMHLSDVRDTPAELLSSAQQRRMMMAIALATRPTLLLLDEPTSGMSAEETAEVVDLVGKIRTGGVSVLLIEHNMKVAMGVCDRIVAIESGEKITEGPPEEVAANEKVIEAYLGKD